ncbi:MAG TPA: SDR family oxidoreductase [Ignavibacteria bacterium]|nr:SDR family oxidoreductase [Ignavibacteria bacterium]
MSDKKIAIVTGGTGALGRAIVHRLASEGIKVYVPSITMEEFKAVFDRSQDLSEDVPDIKSIFSFVCDALDESSVIDFVDSVSKLEGGRIDYLINTVGGIHPKVQISDMDTALLDIMYDLNFKSTFWFSREVLKRMKVTGYGRIISIGAIAALEPSPGVFAYSMAKAGVINLMDTISAENKDSDIRANTIIPSILDTPANREWGSEDDIKTWVKPENIAEIIYSFLQDSFSEVRQSTIKVYGRY